MSIDHSTEMFREILRLPGYRFGNRGTVQSRRKRGPGSTLLDHWTLLIPTYDSRSGYQVGVFFGRYCQIHRLILEAFVGPCPEGMQCRHLDGNRTNNAPSNLVWGTAKENAKDRDRHGMTASRPGELHHNVKLTADRVIEIRRRVAAGEPRRLIAAEFEMAISTVHNIISGYRWKHLEKKE